MTMNSPYRYQLLLVTETGEALGLLPVEPDRQLLTDQVGFAALRQGRVTPDDLQQVDFAIVPRWLESAGPPYAGALDVCLRSTDGKTLTAQTFPTELFTAYAKQAAQALLRQGRLAAGDTIRFLLVAHPVQGDDPSNRRFTIRDVSSPLALKTGTIGSWLRRSTACGPVGEDYPVFIPASVLAQFDRLIREAGPVETGGVLIGHLHRDARPEIFAVVTAVIPARHVQASATTLRLTAQTWAAVSDAIRLRGRKEQILGWVHSHPVRYWCAGCDSPPNHHCSLAATPFLSREDVLLHRAAFGRAWHVALLASDYRDTDGWQTTYSLFGWRGGQLAYRGHYLLDAAESASTGPSPVILEGDETLCHPNASPSTC